MRKPSLREVKPPVQGHTAGKEQSGNHLASLPNSTIISSAARTQSEGPMGIWDKLMRVTARVSFAKSDSDTEPWCFSVDSWRTSIIMTLPATSLSEGAGMWPASQGFSDPWNTTVSAACTLHRWALGIEAKFVGAHGWVAQAWNPEETKDLFKRALSLALSPNIINIESFPLANTIIDFC